MSSMCDNVLKVFNEFKDLMDSFLIFLEQQNYQKSAIAEKTFKVYKNYLVHL